MQRKEKQGEDTTVRNQAKHQSGRSETWRGRKIRMKKIDKGAEGRQRTVYNQAK
jgi:hypothetical protein